MGFGPACAGDARPKVRIRVPGNVEFFGEYMVLARK